MTIYGYARVSTDGQTVAAQVADLRAASAAKVYSETASGAKTDRAELAKVMRILRPGDVLMVTRLDRLARSTRDLLNTLHALGERQIGLKSLVDSWADTDDRPRAAAADPPSWDSRVRAGAYPRSHRRGPQACQRAGCPVR